MAYLPLLLYLGLSHTPRTISHRKVLSKQQTTKATHTYHIIHLLIYSLIHLQNKLNNDRLWPLLFRFNFSLHHSNNAKQTQNGLQRIKGKEATTMPGRMHANPATTVRPTTTHANAMPPTNATIPAATNATIPTHAAIPAYAMPPTNATIPANANATTMPATNATIPSTTTNAVPSTNATIPATTTTNANAMPPTNATIPANATTMSPAMSTRLCASQPLLLGTWPLLSPTSLTTKTPPQTPNPPLFFIFCHKFLCVHTSTSLTENKKIAF